MDYLSRVLRMLPRDREEKLLLSVPEEAASFALGKGNPQAQLVSPTEELPRSPAVAALLQRWETLEKTVVSAAHPVLGKQEPSASVHGSRFSAPKARQEDAVFSRGEAMAVSAVPDSELLSRIFQRDARRYG